jgi:hypothetical protein
MATEIWKYTTAIGLAIVLFSMLAYGLQPDNNSNATVNEPITTPTTTETHTEETTPDETPVQTALLIDTYPEGATVVLNGENIGETPIRIECGPGEYELRLHLDGYEDVTQTITVEEGKETPYEYTLIEEDVTEEQTTEEETTTAEPETVDEPQDETLVTENPVVTPTPENTTKDCITLKLTKMVCRVLGTTDCLKFGQGTKVYDVTWNGKDYYLIEKK